MIGAYRPDMREVDDEGLKRARIFVDSYDTTVGHIGEIKIPLEAGTITRDDLLAEHYEPEKFTRIAMTRLPFSRMAAARIWT